MRSTKLTLQCVLLITAVSLVDCTGSAPSALPWEIWHDLHRLAELDPTDQVLLRSSYCPSGCRFDRHSADDWRYLRLDGEDGEEGVIFEEQGAGAITRIWFTTGRGVSQSLPSSVRLRIYLDHATRPVVDLPLPDLFNGSSPPFVSPLVGERSSSSGGNFSYVPIPYREGCRVTLEGAHGETLWFQLTHHRLDEPKDVKSFTGREDLRALSTLLSTRGTDPWPRDGERSTSKGRAHIPIGGSVLLAELDGPDSLTAVRLKLPERNRQGVGLQLVFDGEERVNMPLSDFFAAGRNGMAPTRSLLVGTSADQWLYAYFPMPFFENAEIHLSDLGAAPLEVTFELRRADRAPSPRSGLFGAWLEVDQKTQSGVDFPLLKLSGEGKWVGLFAELGSVATTSRQYLEGDERIFIDGSPDPVLHGTGVEDFFNGGFYFDQGPFQLALHGAPYHLMTQNEDVTAAYRLMLTDAVPFTRGIKAGLEGGPTDNLSLRRRTVAYYYLNSSEERTFSDGFESGDLKRWTSSSAND